MTNIREKLAEQYDELLFADGYDSAIIGVACGHDSARVVYNVQLMIDACMQEAGMTHQDSVEWLEYNTFGAYVGANTPIYVEMVDFEKQSNNEA
tara:strand:+ start:173 stop:454 length:282 start_codon:yes stop_codon:yes gene_type:complete